MYCIVQRRKASSWPYLLLFLLSFVFFTLCLGPLSRVGSLDSSLIQAESFKKLGTAEALTNFLEAHLPSAWAADVVLHSIDFYRRNADAFGNKNDFPVAKYLVDVMCQDSPILFV